ncbi:hypothetical protein D4Q80_02960 [bacterium]|nr:MAG: hypothetical protein D4Q80_02960 [bacterium]
MNLKNKRILITAGPTWVPIDSVRVISNIATGETGILLANKLVRRGARVTLFLGPVNPCCLDKRVRLINFKFFDQLRNGLKKELRAKIYDIVIHNAAVSDYKPQVKHTRKIKSGRKKLKITLVPTPKIIDSIRKSGRSLFLVGFKFEPDAEKNRLINKARALKKRSALDLAVANTISKGQYRAYIIGKSRVYGPLPDKGSLVNRLVKAIGENYARIKP